MKDIYNIIGYIGSFFVSILLFPQILKCYRIASAKELSTITLLIQVFSSACFLIYAIGIWDKYGFQDALPIFIGNGMILIFTFILLYFQFVKFKT